MITHYDGCLLQPYSCLVLDRGWQRLFTLLSTSLHIKNGLFYRYKCNPGFKYVYHYNSYHTNIITLLVFCTTNLCHDHRVSLHIKQVSFQVYIGITRSYLDASFILYEQICVGLLRNSNQVVYKKYTVHLARDRQNTFSIHH